MQFEVVNIQGKSVGTVDVADEVFMAPVREHLLWEVVNAQRASWRRGTHSTKKRDEVRGGGRKPYRQKGTGNARQGSTRAPNFVGGGTVFGPHPRDYGYTVPRKVRRAALASALSLRAREKKVLVVDSLKFDSPKTKTAAGILKILGAESALIIDIKDNGNLAMSVRNLEESKWLAPEGLNVYDILNYPTLVIAKAALKAVESRIVVAAELSSAAG